MELIGQYDSPFVRRVGIALVRYGMVFKHRPYSSFDDGERFHEHNPLRRVPTLVLEDGEALIDSDAILDHLDERAGRDRALISPAGPARRAAMRRCALALGLSEKAVSFFYMRSFAHALDEQFVQRCISQIHDGIRALDRECAARSDAWWFGDDPGHDDIAVACTVRHVLDAFPGSIEIKGHPALNDHCLRAEARPEFKKIRQPFLPPRRQGPR